MSILAKVDFDLTFPTAGLDDMGTRRTECIFYATRCLELYSLQSSALKKIINIQNPLQIILLA